MNDRDRTVPGVSRRSVLLGAGGLAAAQALALPAAAADAIDPSAWNALRQQLRGTLVLPGDGEFGSAKALFDPQFDRAAPVAVVSAATAEDVQAAAAFAHEHRLAVSARSGGHSYVGASATDAALVIDVRRLDAIAVDGDRVTIGSGATTYAVQTALAASGLTLPLGTCPTVGIAGLTLGGGLGVDNRRYGLTCDRLLSATLVLPNGSTAETSAAQLPGLFWALRGAGGACGIVTSLTYRTHPAESKDIVRVSFPADSAARVLTGWAQWLPSADRAVWSNLEVWATGTGIGCAAMIVCPAGRGEAATTELATAAMTAPTSVTSRTLPHLDAVGHLGGGTTTPRSTKVAGSDVVDRLSATVSEAIVETITARSRSGAQGYVLIDPLDGAVRDTAADATAFPWRHHAAVLQWIVEAPASPPDARRWIADAHRALGPAAAGAYTNYVEPDADPQRYYGDNLTRLRAVRQAVDPDRRLRPGIPF
ncbi:FAD-binding oxidoreductase [Nocardia transvalensis]|uniref:FAD-binding oxidoreductase n=1 Tax=Nocardia transvalensis TaxID=37333 RepID=UPI001893A33F|nr:FAD-binding oxidoreductase [Nocardia transvalensis]MBF6331307.1 FAD-binding oxidoreductase [Nocardia transvalensis]